MIKILQIFVRLVVTVPLKIFGYRYVKCNCTYRSGSVIIANHVSFADVFVISTSFSWKAFLAISPIKFMTANVLIDKPVLGMMIRIMGGFPASEHKKFDYGIEAAKRHLRSGASIMIFPQGTRVKQKPSSTVRLRSGAKVIAEERDVIPVLIKHTGYKKYAVQGKGFNARDLTIDQMMDRVWNLENNV